MTIEFTGDWYKDPWGWPELRFMIDSAPNQVRDNLKSTGARRVALIDVPKENWASRPAVVLDIVDRLMYQALVDELSLSLIAGLPAGVFGWRLPLSSPDRGTYASNRQQWDAYRDRLKELVNNDVALKTDIVSFFASVPTDVVGDFVSDRCRTTEVSTRLMTFLNGSQRPERSGLPQRSLASSVLANMVLSPLDDVLMNYSAAVDADDPFSIFAPGFTRWMDDIWLFVDDAARARTAQRELQHAAHSIRLNLNSAKTDLFEGDDVAEQALEIEHSAVDEAIADESDFGKLEDMIDRIVEDPDHIGRTTVRFAVSRLLRHKSDYGVDTLMDVAHRMPHASDVLARLFKLRRSTGPLQDWFSHYVSGEWASFPWAVAQYGRMFTSHTKPRRETREYFAERLSDANTELPLLAISAQRLSHWDKPLCRALAGDVLRRSDNPQSRRVVALAALAAGAPRLSIRRWLRSEPENAVTLELAEETGFRALPERPSYAR